MKPVPSSNRLPHHSLALVASLVLLGMLFLIPLPYPTSVAEEDPEPGQVVAIYEGHPLHYTVNTAAEYWSGIAVWTNAQPTTPADSPVIVEIFAANEAVPLRRVVTTFGAISRGESRELGIHFFPITHTAGSTYQVVITTPALVETHALLVRRPISEDLKTNNNFPVANTLLHLRPVAQILYQELLTESTQGEDIYYYWHRGRQILAGENPYSCALDDTCFHHKNPGHFPLFYWLSAAASKAGYAQYDDWIAFWRPVLVGAYFAVGALIFITLYRRQQIALAWLGTLFWLFNRWTLYVAKVGQISFFTTFFVLLSLALFKKRPWLSLLAFSVSLALKQTAIFLLPLYLF